MQEIISDPFPEAPKCQPAPPVQKPSYGPVEWHKCANETQNWMELKLFYSLDGHVEPPQCNE